MEIVAYAVLDYVALTEVRGGTVTISRLTHESGAPGKVFKLTESEMVDALKPSLSDEKALGLSTLTGALQLAWQEDPALIATRILDRYYEPEQQRAAELCAGSEGDRPVQHEQLEDAIEQPSRSDEAGSEFLVGAA